MPSNPQHHLGHNHRSHLCHQAPTNISCCPSCCCHCNSSTPSSLPPPSISVDQLLQYMTADHIKLQPFLKPQQIHYQAQNSTQSLLNALIRRVSAVESSLSQLTSHSPPNKSPPPSSCRQPHATSPPPPSPPPTSPPPTMPSLREVAARTIQARFRRFLVLRSQALRDLKRLASIKYNAASLRSLISGDASAEPTVLSQMAMDLLLQLDSIQSSDPMIRDGKRSISRELTAMLDYVEKVLVRERRLSLRAMEVQEDTSPRLPRRSAKRVTFAEHGGKEDNEGFSRVLEEEVFVHENGTFFHGQGDGFGLSAPLPLQMEPRLGL